MEVMDSYSYHLISIDGGKVDNAIPDQVLLKVVLMNDIDIQSLQKTIEDKLFQLGEDHAVVEIRSCNETVVSFDESSTKKIMKYLGKVPN